MLLTQIFGDERFAGSPIAEAIEPFSPVPITKSTPLMEATSSGFNCA